MRSFVIRLAITALGLWAADAVVAGFRIDGAANLVIAALLLGITDTACKYLVPELGAFFIFAAIIGLLLWRPHGLAGRE